MSMWGTEAIPIDKMESGLAQIISVADYVASRKYFEPTSTLSQALERFRA
jgi:hypothetical protein